MPNAAYIWQRQWTAGVSNAVRDASDLVNQWRILAGYSDDGSHLGATAPNWDALNDSGKPIVLVVRIDGQLAQWDEDALLADLRSLLHLWRSHTNLLVGLEIDHDSATARLPAYADFLHKVRGQLDKPIRLSITALPAWLDSPDFEALLEPVDEVVLQVHAVQAPQLGIFNGPLADRWIGELSKRTNKPFRIALPTYGARAVLADNGGIRAVESEVPLMAGGSRFADLTVTPDEIASFLRKLERDPPRHLAGIVWFRLPVDGDRRTWSPATLRAVISAKPLARQIDVLLAPQGTPGLIIISLRNAGEIDAPLPRRVELPDDCDIADGINGFARDREGRRVVLFGGGATVLHEHQEMPIGWARCTMNPGDIHVQQ